MMYPNTYFKLAKKVYYQQSECKNNVHDVKFQVSGFIPRQYADTQSTNVTKRVQDELWEEITLGSAIFNLSKEYIVKIIDKYYKNF